MGISRELINQFVKATKDAETKKTESIVYGTVVQKVEATTERNETVFVQFDGSTLPTPVITTADTKVKDRVTVMIKNHTAIVTGNVSSPAARTADVKEIAGSSSTNYEDVKKSLSAVTNDVKECKNDIDNLQKSELSLTEVVDGHGASISAMNKLLTNQGTNITNINQRLDGIVEDIESHGNSIIAINKRLDDIVKDIEDIVTRLDELSS